MIITVNVYTEVRHLHALSNKRENRPEPADVRCLARHCTFVILFFWFSSCTAQQMIGFINAQPLDHSSSCAAVFKKNFKMRKMKYETGRLRRTYSARPDVSLYLMKRTQINWRNLLKSYTRMNASSMETWQSAEQLHLGDRVIERKGKSRKPTDDDVMNCVLCGGQRQSKRPWINLKC